MPSRPDFWNKRYYSPDNLLEVKVYVNTWGRLPTRGSEEAAGWDLYVDLFDYEKGVWIDEIIVHPHRPVKINTGIIVDFPKECMGLLDIRSSFGMRGLDLACRIIDSDYRGFIHLIIKNDGLDPVIIKHNERVAQLVFNPYRSIVKMVQSTREELSSTVRGERGFGSTGRF